MRLGHGAPGLAIAILKKAPSEKRSEEPEDLALEVAADFRKAIEEKDDKMVLETMRAMMDMAAGECDMD